MSSSLLNKPIIMSGPQLHLSQVQEALDSQDHVDSSLSSPEPCALTAGHSGLPSMVTPEILPSTATDKKRPSVSGREVSWTPASYLNKSSLI